MEIVPKGKRFATDFERIDVVKPNDKILIYDSEDEVVKYATPSQLSTVPHDAPFDPLRAGLLYPLEYARIANWDSSAPLEFYIPWVSEHPERYEIHFYRHIRARHRHRINGIRHYHFTYGWIHPADDEYISNDSDGIRQKNTMRNPNRVSPIMVLSEFKLKATDKVGCFRIMHPKGMVDPDGPLVPKDIVSPFIWRIDDAEFGADSIRVSFGGTLRNFPDTPAGRPHPLRNMGFAVVDTETGERVTGILPFSVKFEIDKEREGNVFFYHR